jgi:hypothetical protein
MEAKSISDQKRLVRGEHWLATRTFLRARDNSHHRAWKILMIAGPSPHEEINCIRELMPKTFIVAVDIDHRSVSAALAASADKALLCDITSSLTGSDLSAVRELWPGTITGMFPPRVPPFELWDNYDAISLDLTGPADAKLATAVQTYWHLLQKGGVMQITFSYGRDVVEHYKVLWDKALQRHPGGFGPNINAVYLQELGISDLLAARILLVLNERTKKLVSVLQYSGKSMPMVSCLLVKDRQRYPAKYCVVSEGDFEAAVTAENLGNIYACPADRILFLRRSAIAQRGVATRKARLIEQKRLPFERAM